jgi:lipoyl(octanoyl) transferase
MDLAPFSAIDPCGYPGLRVTQMSDLGFDESPQSAGQRLVEILMKNLDA